MAVTLNVVLTIAAIALLIIGFIGCIVPVIPGPPLGWAALLCAYFCNWNTIALWLLIVCAVAALAVTILDNIMPAVFTKKSGGSKAGSRGCMIGLIIGMFTGPWGVIIGPFVGALIGETIHDSSDSKKIFKAAFGAFKGFLSGVGMKMIVVFAFIWIYIISFFIGK